MQNERPSGAGFPEGAATPHRAFLLVGMGEVRVTRRAMDVLVARGLGSCIALCMYDPVAQAAGMAHIVLPASLTPEPRDAAEALRFADVAVPHLLREMEKDGAVQDRLGIAVVGAADVFVGGNGKRLDIGARNLAAVREALKERGVHLVAHDVGGASGRVCQLFARDGRVVVRTIGAGEREIAVLGAERKESAT